MLALLAAAAEEGPPPLIDVDGTLLVQLALFIIMYLVLSQLLFKPYLKMRQERGESIEGARKQAHDMDAQAAAMMSDYEAKMNRAKLRGAEERALKRSEAASRERELLGAARDESQKALQQARMRNNVQMQQAKTKLEGEASALAKMMARKILGREVA